MILKKEQGVVLDVNTLNLESKHQLKLSRQNMFWLKFFNDLKVVQNIGIILE